MEVGGRCLFALWISVWSASAQAQVPRPHAEVGHVHPLAALDAMASMPNPPPYETPASLACIYRLVPVVVPGCLVLRASAMPTGGKGIITIVNAYHYPTAANDLKIAGEHFRMSPCTPENGCFHQLYAAGAVPTVDPLWSLNAAPLIQYAHAFAPGASIYLVEASGGTLGELIVAIRKANEILASQGGGSMIIPFSIDEAADEVQLDELFTTPGVVYIAGNSGTPQFMQYPATSPNVLSVGGTALIRNAAGYFLKEIATTYWAGGPSAFEGRPSYQDGIADIVGTHRGVPDVAFATDPAVSPELFYLGVNFDGIIGWTYQGQLGIAQAIWAAMINAAGSDPVNSAAELRMLYSHLDDPRVFRDITEGVAISVPATKGWDFVTGLGSTHTLMGK